MWRYHVYARKLNWYFTGVYIINHFISSSHCFFLKKTSSQSHQLTLPKARKAFVFHFNFDSLSFSSSRRKSHFNKFTVFYYAFKFLLTSHVFLGKHLDILHFLFLCSHQSKKACSVEAAELENRDRKKIKARKKNRFLKVLMTKKINSLSFLSHFSY